jgi:predicted nucleotide-binding protein (sugar kinase/HSP70/actin superfamily)
MSIKVGIPRALLYYHYYPGWEAFFRTLGAQVVLSDETTKTILDRGVRDAVDEACLPVKLYLGHLANLRDKKVDCIFAPRVVSVERKKYLCPKFLGLPEMARFCVPDLPELLDMEINVHQKHQETRNNLYKLAARINWRPWVIHKALREARAAQEFYEATLRQGKTPSDVFSGNEPAGGTGRVRVALMGHAYNLNDPYISMNLIERLRDLDVDVVTSEMLRPQDICRGTHCLEKDIFWTFGKELMGAAFHLHEQGDIQGMILVASFGCGPDSLVCEMVERVYKRNKKVPVLLLTLDEHTGEAGVVTRIEAFVDMLRWRDAM